MTVKAKKIPVIAKQPGLTITHDSTVELSGTTWSSNQLWPTASGVRPFWSDGEITTANTQAIAIVDSGIEKNRSDFDMGDRVIKEVNLTTLPNNSPGVHSLWAPATVPKVMGVKGGRKVVTPISGMGRPVASDRMPRPRMLDSTSSKWRHRNLPTKV